MISMTVLSGSYDYRLVALSIMMAMFASYAALDLAGRVTAAHGWGERSGWALGLRRWAWESGRCTTSACSP